MHSVLYALIPAVLSVDAAMAQAPTPSPSPRSVTAFVHVGVVPMDDTNRVLQDQTVLVRGDRIVGLGPAASTAVPVGATRIDGRGKYLIPGLGDMHTHVGVVSRVSIGGSVSEAEIRITLFADLTNGVTTIRNVNYFGKNAPVLQARAQAAAGQLWSPRIYASGQWWTDTTRSVAQNLAAYQAAGYDFVKLHGMPGEQGTRLDSIAQAAVLLGLPIMGHVNAQQPDSLLRALARHYTSIEHLTGYPGGGISPDSPSMGVLADTVRLPELIAATMRAGIWNCPTQAMYDVLFPLASATPEVHLWIQLRRRIIKGLQDAGAGLLLGTDLVTAPEELAALVRAGLTPYQALAAGTRNVAAYFGKLRDEGTVTVGKRADLVLLAGNPLEDIGQAAHPAGVMVAGRWLSRAAMDRRLAAIAAADSTAARKARDKPPGGR